MSFPVSKCLPVIAAVLLVTSGQASAQICGDADLSGSVTVTDGVQTLRAAAGLTSTCTDNACDIDGSGSITVTDGVNVLRKAAGIAIAEACPGAVDTQVQNLLRDTLPIFGGLTKIGTGAQAAATGGACDNADGSFTFDDSTGEITFSNCELDGFLYDGTLGISSDGSTLSFDLSFDDLTTDESFDFFGDITFRQTSTGGVISGGLEVDFIELGFLNVTFEEIQTDTSGNFVGGSLFFDATDSDIDGVTGVRVGFNTSTVLPVQVILTDQSQVDFDFDLVSGDLTPASN
jgi:hypothetical protein